MMLTAEKLKSVQNILDRIEDAVNAVDAVEEVETGEAEFPQDRAAERSSELHRVGMKLRELRDSVETLYS